MRHSIVKRRHQFEAEPLSIAVPPDPESSRDWWGLAWEDQVAAALLWQEAGRVHRPAEESLRPPSRRRGLERSWAPKGGNGLVLSIDEMGQIAGIMADTNERLLHLQNIANDVINAEQTLRRRPRVLAPPSLEGSPAGPQEESGGNPSRMRSVVRSWLRTADEARARLAELAGLEPGTSVVVERRRQSKVIDFADRRRAAR